MLGARAASRQKRNSFTSNWDTTQAGSANDSVDLENYPLRPDGSYNFKVYWGDGTTDIITSYNQAETLHQYASTGIYEIRIGGEISGLIFNNGGDKSKILNINNWCPLKIFGTDIFEGCSNLKLTTTDSLTTPVSTYFMFASCSNIGSEGNMNRWDTSDTTNMSYMFYNANRLDQPLGNWDTSSVTNMSHMFYTHYAINPKPIFNEDLSNWDTSSVTDMTSMFVNNSGFNNGGSTGINNWDVSNVTTFNTMFYDAISFNQPIGSWDTRSATNMSQMFGNRRLYIGH